MLAVVVSFFGSSKIPQFARSIGQARKQFDNGWKGIASDLKPPVDPQGTSVTSATVTPPASPVATVVAATSAGTAPSKDPLLIACENEGITTVGKTREQLASELS